MLYSGDDVKSVLRQLWVFAVIDVIVLVGGFIYAFYVALNDSTFWGGVIATLVLCLFIFLLGNTVLPCVHYYKYLIDVFTGKYTRRSGIVSRISDKPLYKDNKNYYYEVDVDLGDSKYGMFLYDANVGEPEFSVGDNLIITCYENFIVKAE